MHEHRTDHDMLMNQNSTSVSTGDIPLYIFPTSICIGKSQKERNKREVRSEWGDEREEQNERRGGEIREKELMDFLSE